MESLWGEFDLENMSTPKSILEEQAKHLPKLTKNFVYAVLEEELSNKYLDKNKRTDFNYSFHIKGKFVENYSYRAFSIHHSIEMYPLIMRVSSEVKKDITIHLVNLGLVVPFISPEYEDIQIEIKNEKMFVDVIKVILKSEKIHMVISSLVALSRRN